jgi:hypothetical protein
VKRFWIRVGLFFLFFWELPQNLVGLFLIYIVNFGADKVMTYDGIKIR